MSNDITPGSPIFELFQHNASWIYYSISILGAIATLYKLLLNKIEKLEITKYLAVISEVPESIKSIELNQNKLFAEMQLQGKIAAALLDAIAISHFICDANGLCIKVNSQWTMITGLSENEALGHNWILAVHPDDRDRVQSKWAEMIEKYAPFEEVFRYRHRHTGECTRVSCHATDVLDKNGNRVFIIGFSRSIFDTPGAAS